MAIVNIYEAKVQLSSLIKAVLNGEEVSIANAGVPKVKIIPYNQSQSDVNGFEFGAMRGEIKISPDFDAPLSEEILALFERGESM